MVRRRYDVPIRRRGDAPLRRLRDVPSRRRWVFHLSSTCDVTGTYRETSLRRLNAGWGVLSWRYISLVLYLHGFILPVYDTGLCTGQVLS